jgi:hypothetical protein
MNEMLEAPSIYILNTGASGAAVASHCKPKQGGKETLRC